MIEGANNTILFIKIIRLFHIKLYFFERLILAKYIPRKVIPTNSNCVIFKNSEKIKEASIVAVKGCISKPIEPLDAEILAMPIVIKNCPPNWHKNAKSIKLPHSIVEVGIFTPPSITVGIIEKMQQKKVV